jgi:hypothetical protein
MIRVVGNPPSPSRIWDRYLVLVHGEIYDVYEIVPDQAGLMKAKLTGVQKGAS